MKVYHVYASRRYIVVATDEADAIEVMFTNGCVRKRENVKKVVDITDDYAKWHPSFDVSLHTSGELSVYIDGKTSTYQTYLKGK